MCSNVVTSLLKEKPAPASPNIRTCMYNLSSSNLKGKLTSPYEVGFSDYQLTITFAADYVMDKDDNEMVNAKKTSLRKYWSSHKTRVRQPSHLGHSTAKDIWKIDLLQ